MHQICYYARHLEQDLLSLVVLFLTLSRRSFSSLSTTIRSFVLEHDATGSSTSAATVQSRGRDNDSRDTARLSSPLLLSPDRAHKRTKRDAPPSALGNVKRGGNNLGSSSSCSSVIVVTSLRWSIGSPFFLRRLRFARWSTPRARSA